MEEIKNIFQRRIKFLGKSISVLTIALLLFGSGTALLVGYLSNTVTTTITVESPLRQYVSLDSISWVDTGINLPDLYCGENRTFYIKTENLAEVPVTGSIVTTATNNLGLTCADFDAVTVRTSINNQTYGQSYDLIALQKCSIINTTAVKFSYEPANFTWVQGQVNINEVNLVFKQTPQCSIGTFVLSTQVTQPV